jgi:basic membrane protein A
VRKLLCLVLIGCLCVSLMVSGCGQTAKDEEKKQFKIAAVIPGPINDNGWNATCYEGLMQAKKDLNAEVAYSENVPPSDFEENFRNFASQGYNLIIGHGFELADAAKKVAKEYPKVTILITDGNVFVDPNVGSFSVLAKQAGFLGGVIASTLTQTGKVAIVGGLEIPPITQSIEGFIQGAKYVNPNVTVLSTLTGTFDDVAKAKEISRVYIEQGADIIMHSANQSGMGVIEAAKDKKVLAIGIVQDQSNLAPDTVVASCTRNIPGGIAYMAKMVKDGNFKAEFYPLGVKENVVGISWNKELETKVTKEQKEKIDKVLNDLKEGKIDLDKLPK